MGTCKIQYNGSIISELEETGDVVIKYNNIPIRTLSGSVTGTSTEILSCNGKYMTGNLTIGSKTLSCQNKMMNSDITVTLDNPQEIYYLFDSSRSDNFIFGRYVYGASEGGVTSYRTAWPPGSSDGENTQSGQIILNQKPSGFLAPVGSMNAYLNLYPNNTGISGYTDNTLFVNNVYYEGHNANTITFALPGTGVRLGVRAYRTKTSGTPTISYVNSSGTTTYGSISVTGTTETVYYMDITVVSGGYFKLNAVSGCGSLIVKDIWVE